jgi:hypothetical protein
MVLNAAEMLAAVVAASAAAAPSATARQAMDGPSMSLFSARRLSRSARIPLAVCGEVLSGVRMTAPKPRRPLTAAW